MKRTMAAVAVLSAVASVAMAVGVTGLSASSALTLAVNVSSAPVETKVDGQSLRLPAHGFVLR